MLSRVLLIQFCDMKNWGNVPKTLVKLVNFTLEMILFANFPKISARKLTKSERQNITSVEGVLANKRIMVMKNKIKSNLLNK